MARPKAHPHVLLVEGPDDCHVLWAFLQRHAFPETFTVEAAQGKEALLQSVPVRLSKAAELRTLGVILDADTSARQTWLKLRDRVPQLPEIPDPAGTVLDLPERRFGAWLMPDNRADGMLEDFLAFMVTPGDPLLGEVDALMGRLPARPHMDALAWRSKARIHTWLGLQEEPGKPLGQAVTARYVDADGAKVKPLLAWLSRLFPGA